MIPFELLNTITTGDARELCKQLPNDSIDLIFTDPIYDRMDDYKWLAETAMRILKPNCAALIWCGIGYLPQTIEALQNGGLSYRWMMIALRPTGVHSRYAMNRVFSNWRSLLWFEKGKSNPVLTISDALFSKDNNQGLYHGKWDKSVLVGFNWLYRFTDDGWIVFDPFTGGGTIPIVAKMLGRQFVAFEIDSEKADIARERLCKTQPPLFTPEMQQGNLFLQPSPPPPPGLSMSDTDTGTH